MLKINDAVEIKRGGTRCPIAQNQQVCVYAACDSSLLVLNTRVEPRAFTRRPTLTLIEFVAQLHFKVNQQASDE